MSIYPDLSVYFFLTIQFNRGLMNRLDSCSRFSLYLRGVLSVSNFNRATDYFDYGDFRGFPHSPETNFRLYITKNFHFMISTWTHSTPCGVALKSVNLIHFLVLTGMFVFKLASQITNGITTLWALHLTCRNSFRNMFVNSVSIKEIVNVFHCRF
jgi:hypothetical protein